MEDLGTEAETGPEQFDLAKSLGIGDAVEFRTEGGVIVGEVISIVGTSPMKIHIESPQGEQYTLVPEGLEQDEPHAVLWHTPERFPGPKDILINMSREGYADTVQYDTLQKSKG